MCACACAHVAVGVAGRAGRDAQAEWEPVRPVPAPARLYRAWVALTPHSQQRPEHSVILRNLPPFFFNTHSVLQKDGERLCAHTLLARWNPLWRLPGRVRRLRCFQCF